MNLVEFAQTVSKRTLSPSEIYLLKKIELANKNNQRLLISYPPRIGRRNLVGIIALAKRKGILK